MPTPERSKNLETRRPFDYVAAGLALAAESVAALNAIASMNGFQDKLPDIVRVDNSGWNKSLEKARMAVEQRKMEDGRTETKITRILPSPEPYAHAPRRPKEVVCEFGDRRIKICFQEQQKVAKTKSRSKEAKEPFGPKDVFNN